MYSTIAEFIKEWNEESALTQKILDTLTDSSLDQQVSADNRTLGRIAWHITTVIPEYLADFGFPVELERDPSTVPSSAKEIAQRFREISEHVAKIAEQQWTDESLQQVQNAFGRDLPNAEILSQLIKHNIHHRGQMTVLMRQAGLKIPGVYGPAREQWSQIGLDVPVL